MKKKTSVTLVFSVVFILVLALLLFMRPTAPKEDSFHPVITYQTDHSTTIAWTSGTPYTGTIYYQAEVENAEIKSVRESLGSSTRHEITLDSLTPGTRYSYWLKDNPSRFQFTTVQGPAGFFSFLIIPSNRLNEALSHYIEEMPEWILLTESLDSIKEESRFFFDSLKGVFPFVSVICANGHLSLLESPDSKSVSISEGRTQKESWPLSWGGLDLTFIQQKIDPSFISKMKERWKDSVGHTRGLFFTRSEFTKITDDQDQEAFPPFKLHSELAAYNQENTEKAISFVFIIGEKKVAVKKDEIMYVGFPAESSDVAEKDGAVIRVDVHPESVSATYLNAAGEVISLKSPPMLQNRTCADCRRLADQGAYRESIDAYKSFIANNQGHYQVDDALFAIAELYDTRLFLFPEAHEWYKKFIREYPSSTLVPLARQRITYLDQYADFDYIPLARFEEIKRVDYIKAGTSIEQLNQVFVKARKIIDDYPKASISPMIAYWLANQLRSIDYKRAVDVYNELILKFPDSPVNRDAFFEIGETLYLEREYKGAIEAYERAKTVLKDQTDEIDIQIGRAKRNIRRGIIAYVAIAILSALLIFSFMVPPVRAAWMTFRPFVVAWAVLSPIYTFGAWLINEQFTSKLEWILFSIGSAFVISFGYPVSKLLWERISRNASPDPAGSFLQNSVSILIHIMFVLCGGYILIYYVNEHYLIMINM